MRRCLRKNDERSLLGWGSPNIKADGSQVPVAFQVLIGLSQAARGFWGLELLDERFSVLATEQFSVSIFPSAN